MKILKTFELLVAEAVLCALPALAFAFEPVIPAASAGSIENQSDAIDHSIAALHRCHEREFKTPLSDLELWYLEGMLKVLSGIPVSEIPFEQLVDARSMCSIIAEWNFLNFEDERHQEISTLARKLGNKFNEFLDYGRGDFAQPYLAVTYYAGKAVSLSRDEINALASALIKIADLEEWYIQRDFVEQLEDACAAVIEDKNGMLANAAERRPIVIKAAEDLKARLAALG